MSALHELVLLAKESGFELEKTFIGKMMNNSIAHMYVLENAAILSKNHVKRYIRGSKGNNSYSIPGRGRYGSIPHYKSALVQFILQERDKPFTKRLNDPLGKEYNVTLRMGSYSSSSTASIEYAST